MTRRNRPSQGTGMPERCSPGKGTLRRAKDRRALAGCAPFRRELVSDGRLRRDHEAGEVFCWPGGQGVFTFSERRLHKTLDRSVCRRRAEGSSFGSRGASDVLLSHAELLAACCWQDEKSES